MPEHDEEHQQPKVVPLAKRDRHPTPSWRRTSETRNPNMYAPVASPPTTLADRAAGEAGEMPWMDVANPQTLGERESGKGEK
jgi:hypothetical protein